MISTYKYRDLTWIDAESPNKDEVAHLQESYEIPELAAEELLHHSSRSKVDVYPSLIYLILHFPISTKNGIEEQEIDFVIGHDFIITTRYAHNEPISSFKEFFDSTSRKSRELTGDHAGFIFYFIMKELYKKIESDLAFVETDLRKVEKMIFEDKEESMVQEISKINRKLLDFKQAVRFHSEVLKSFEHAGREFFGSQFSYYLAAISGEYNKVGNVIAGHKEILNDLRDTNDSLLTSKTNETIKTLTIFSFIMLPLTLITGIFGMNSDLTFIKDMSDFLLVVAIMCITGIMMYLYFKGKKWL